MVAIEVAHTMNPPQESAESAVHRIEARLGAELPREYREYLLGGLPWDEERCFLRWKAGKDWPSVVEVDRPYHYVADRVPSKGGFVQRPIIEFMLDTFEARRPGDGLIPKEAMAVASCPTHEEILLFVRGPRAGQVWLKEWTRLDEENVDEPEDGLHFIARTFSDFLRKLQREKEAVM